MGPAGSSTLTSNLDKASGESEGGGSQGQACIHSGCTMLVFQNRRPCCELSCEALAVRTYDKQLCWNGRSSVCMGHLGSVYSSRTRDTE